MTENSFNAIISQISYDLENKKIEVAPSLKELTPRIISYQLNNESYTAKLLEIYGEDKTLKFFKNSSIALIRYLPSLISVCLIKKAGKFVLDEKRILEALQQLGQDIENGKVKFTISYRIIGLAIQEPIVVIEENSNRRISLRMVPENILFKRYPINDWNFYSNEKLSPIWIKNRLEITFECIGKPCEIDEIASIKGGDKLEKSVTNAIVLSKVSPKFRPYATHQLIQSPFHNSLMGLHFNSFTSEPQVLSKEDTTSIKKYFNILCKCEDDNVLSNAMDRFLIATKQGFHHPNKVNVPNWDKIVDYVIAFETLLLTLNNDSSDKGELSYRFKLNGTSLISIVTDSTNREIFNSLGHLYTMRSKIVHGCGESKVIEPIDKFIKVLGIEKESHTHPIGKLMVVCEQLENWLRLLFEYLASLDSKERPFRKQGGWECLLWNESETIKS